MGKESGNYYTIASRVYRIARTMVVELTEGKGYNVTGGGD